MEFNGGFCDKNNTIILIIFTPLKRTKHLFNHFTQLTKIFTETFFFVLWLQTLSQQNLSYLLSFKVGKRILQLIHSFHHFQKFLLFCQIFKMFFCVCVTCKFVSHFKKKCLCGLGINAGLYCTSEPPYPPHSRQKKRCQQPGGTAGETPRVPVGYTVTRGK